MHKVFLNLKLVVFKHLQHAYFFPIDRIISGLHNPFQSDKNLIQTELNMIYWGVYMKPYQFNWAINPITDGLLKGINVSYDILMSRYGLGPSFIVGLQDF